MDKQDVCEKLLVSLNQFLEARDIIPKKDFNYKSEILQNYFLDSLDFVELFVKLFVKFEDDLNITFPENIQDIDTINSISSISDYILNNNLLNIGNY